MKGDIDFVRGTEFVVRLPVRTNVTCPSCGCGEVWQPPQTMDMPMNWECLRCGHHAPAGAFDHSLDTDTP